MRESGLQYTLTTPGGTLTLNPTHFTPPGYFVADIDFAAAVRAEDIDRPQDHGSYLDNAKLAGLSGILEVDVIGSSASNRESLLNALLQAYLSILGEEGTGTLSWTPQDGSAARQISGLQLMDYPTQIRRGGTLKGYHVALKAQKPYAETATADQVSSTAMTAAGGGWKIPLVIPVTFTSSGGGVCSLTNSGTVPVRPVLRIYGPVTSPNVVNVTTGQRLVFTGSIATGDMWEVDLFRRTVTLNGIATSIITTLDVSQSTWFSLGRGSTVLQLTGSAYTSATLLLVYMRSAWG